MTSLTSRWRVLTTQPLGLARRWDTRQSDSTRRLVGQGLPTSTGDVCLLRCECRHETVPVVPAVADLGDKVCADQMRKALADLLLVLAHQVCYLWSGEGERRSLTQAAEEPGGLRPQDAV